MEKEIQPDNLIPAVGLPTPPAPLRASEVQALSRGVKEKQTVHVSSAAGSSPSLKRSSDSINPSSVAAGGTWSTTVSLSGVSMGDFCLPSCARDLQGMLLTAYVSAADTITLVLYNPTGGAIDLDVSSFKVLVFPVDFHTRLTTAGDKTAVFEEGVLTSLT